MPSTKLGTYTISFANSEEYHALKSEIFTRHCYYFETTTPAPRIIDVGAHIGLATLYFKKLFPAADITAFEPQPTNFKLLVENIFQNGLTEVEARPEAIWLAAGPLQLHQDTEHNWLSTTGMTPGSWQKTQRTTPLTVTALPLRNLLTQPITALKLDVEGAEWNILQSAQDTLDQVEHLFVEYHPNASISLTDFQEFLQKRNFTLETSRFHKQLTLIHGFRKSRVTTK